MSMSCFGLRNALSVVPPRVVGYGVYRAAGTYGPDYGGSERTLETLIREGQNRLKAPHLRDYGYRLPIPFRWGPNGSLILLAGLLSAYAALVFVILLIVS